MDTECPSCQYPISSEMLSEQDATTSLGELSGEATQFTCPNCGNSLESATEQTVSLQFDQHFHTNRKFAHFTLIEILGRGGFGTVWLAEDKRLDRQVAVKLPKPRRGNTSSLVREAKTAAQLKHPNIVTVHEVGEHEGQVFIVCEYIKGMDLRTLIKKESLTIPRVVELLYGIADGLHHAHESQVVHRDMKPGNVLVDESGKPLVADFGLAKTVNVEESISSKGRIVGTILYMAPEQASAQADDVDRRADVYAIGVMMYEMLTGERPFRGNVQAILHQKTSEEPVGLRKLRPSIPRDLETICLKCLQRSPNRRYATAAEFNEELKRFQEGVPILARPVSTIEYAWRWCVRNRAVSALLAMLFVSLSLGLAGTTSYWMEARDQTKKAQRSLYASQMMLANNYLGAGDVEATRNTLDRFRSPELQPYRGFEWHFLNQQLQGFTTLVQHGRRVQDLAMSRDGDWFVTVADDKAMRVWDSKSGHQIREIPFSIGRWQAVSISHRDNQLAAGAKDGSFYVWDSIHDEQAPPRVLRHGQGVTKIRYSADGKRLFTAGTIGAVRVWDTSTWEIVQEIPSGQEGVVDFSVSKDGDVLVVAGDDGVMRVWEVLERVKKCEIRSENTVDAVSVSSDGKQLVAGAFDSSLAGYRAEDGELLFHVNTRFEWISDVEFVADSSIVALCSSLGLVGFYNVMEQREVGTRATHNGAGGMLACSRKGSQMVVGSAIGEIRLLDTEDYADATMWQFEEPASNACFVSKDRVVASFHDGSAQLISFHKGAAHPLHPPSGTKLVVDACEQTATIALASPQGDVKLFDKEGTSLCQVDFDGTSPAAIQFSPSGNLLVVGGDTGPIIGYDVTGGKEFVLTELFRHVIEGKARVRGVSVSPDERCVIFLLNSQEIRILSTSQPELAVRSISFSSQPVSVGYFEDDLIVGTRDGFLTRMNLATNEVVWKIKTNAGHLNMITIIANGDAVATVGRDRTVNIWDVVNGEPRIRVQRHQHQIFAVDSSVSGERLVTAGIDGAIRLWVGDQVE